MIATVFPAAENRAAREGPAWPVPMMTASKCFMRSERTFDMQFTRSGRLFRCLPLLARCDVGSVPARPMVLRSRRLIFTMMLLCLAQELGQRPDIQVAESSSGQPRGDLLKQSGVAVGVIECGKGEIAAVIGCQPLDTTVAIGPKLGSGS